MWRTHCLLMRYLVCLLTRQNRLTRRAALALADGVRLNTGLSDLQLNHNPISRAGATAVIHAVNHNKTVTKWGLTGVETRFQVTRHCVPP